MLKPHSLPLSRPATTGLRDWVSKANSICPEVTLCGKLQAPVYDILPSTAAVFSYAIGSRKLSANEQFFVGAQTVVNLLQTIQIISDICFITDYVAYANSNKTKIVWIETELFFFFFSPFFFLLPGVDAPHVYVRAWALGCFHSLISTRTFRRALTASVDSCADKEWPFSSVTKSGRVWRKVPESDARNVPRRLTGRDPNTWKVQNNTIYYQKSTPYKFSG